DNPVLAVLTFGEGYHNFHHHFAHDYRNGVRWWQWDPTKWLIAGLHFVGLTRKLKRTPAFQIQRALLAMQFARAETLLARVASTAAPSRITELRQHIAGEYETFMAAVADWAKIKEQWLTEKKRAVVEHWEHTSFQLRFKELRAAPAPASAGGCAYCRRSSPEQNLAGPPVRSKWDAYSKSA
ncbi:acyl-CoA desaturase, partial [mine drainage metagenome]